MLSITIQGHRFEVSEPYGEGHKLTALEAKALNQIRGENIANNMRTTVLEVLGAERKADKERMSDEEVADLQETIARYDENYDIGQARSRGRSADPVAREARQIAIGLITKQAAAEDMTLSEYKVQLGKGDEEAGKALYSEKVAQVAANPKVIARAKENVEFSVKV